MSFKNNKVSDPEQPDIMLINNKIVPSDDGNESVEIELRKAEVASVDSE